MGDIEHIHIAQLYKYCMKRTEILIKAISIYNMPVSTIVGYNRIGVFRVSLGCICREFSVVW
jgi:hypothetical protein